MLWKCFFKCIKFFSEPTIQGKQQTLGLYTFFSFEWPFLFHPALILCFISIFYVSSVTDKLGFTISVTYDSRCLF